MCVLELQGRSVLINTIFTTYCFHRVGSVRKDSECTFWVLKARFRVLKSRIYRRKAEDVEKMFKVCCCLHSMIMRARDVRAGMAGVNLSDALNKCSLDDGEVYLIQMRMETSFVT